MHLNLNQAITQRTIDLEIEIQRLKDSEKNISRPSAVQELWDKIRVIQKKINRLKEADHPDSSMHFRERKEIQTPFPINLSEPKPPVVPPCPPPAPTPPPPSGVKQQLPIQNEGRSWGYLIGGTMLVGAVAALGFYLLRNISVSSDSIAPPNPPPGCGNQDKPPAIPPCPPPAPTPPPTPTPAPPTPTPAPPKPKKHHHKPTWHIRSAKVFGVPVGIKFEKK